MYNYIYLARQFPLFADYEVLMRQPNFWIESIINLYDAEERVREANEKLKK